MIRAIYEWVMDNNLTPHLVVYADAPNVSVPVEFVNKDNQIVLNIAPRAVDTLEMGNESISFSARFGGVPTDIFVPTHAVVGIYARENGQGMMFDLEPTPPPSTQVTPSPKVASSSSIVSKKSSKKPSLRVVK